MENGKEINFDRFVRITLYISLFRSRSKHRGLRCKKDFFAYVRPKNRIIRHLGQSNHTCSGHRSFHIFTTLQILLVRMNEAVVSALIWADYLRRTQPHVTSSIPSMNQNPKNAEPLLRHRYLTDKIEHKEEHRRFPSQRSIPNDPANLWIFPPYRQTLIRYNQRLWTICVRLVAGVNSTTSSSHETDRCVILV